MNDCLWFLKLTRLLRYGPLKATGQFQVIVLHRSFPKVNTSTVPCTLVQ